LRYQKDRKSEKVVVYFGVWEVGAQNCRSHAVLGRPISHVLRIMRLRSWESRVSNCHKDKQRNIGWFAFYFKTPTQHLCSSSRFWKHDSGSGMILVFQIWMAKKTRKHGENCVPGFGRS
jgi:hypothetical protein